MDDLIQNFISNKNSENSEKNNESPFTFANFKDIGMTEFVGTTIGPTIGLILAGMDSKLAEKMGFEGYRAVGFLGSRLGFNPPAFAVDDAVKETNVKVLEIEIPRDAIGGGEGSSAHFIVGGNDVADVRRCIEQSLKNLDKYYGGIWLGKYGHLDMQWTSRAGECLSKAFGVEVGASFGVINAGPAPIGFILADKAVKSGNVDIIDYRSCSHGREFSFSNELSLTFTGDSSAVHQAVKATIEPGIKLLEEFGGEVKCMGTPYI